MHALKYLIWKKLNKLGIKQKFDDRSICVYARQFIKDHLQNISIKNISNFYGNLMIEANNSVEANELHFFEEELKYFLESKGYKIKKIRIVS